MFAEPYADQQHQSENLTANILRPIKVSSCSHESVQNIMKNNDSSYGSHQEKEPAKTSLLQVSMQKTAEAEPNTYRSDDQMRTSLTVVSGRYINDEKENGMVFGRQSGLFKIYESRKRPH